MSRYIDADKVISELLNNPYHNYMRIYLNSVPVEPNVKPVMKGEWIIQSGEVVCSNCYEPNIETNYCPHCGADMRGKKSEV